MPVSLRRLLRKAGYGMIGDCGARTSVAGEGMKRCG